MRYLLALLFIITACATNDRKPCEFDGSCNEELYPPPTMMEEKKPEAPKAPKVKPKKQKKMPLKKV